MSSGTKDKPDDYSLKSVQLGPTQRSIPVSWDVVRLEDIAELKRGASPRPIGDSRFFGGDVGWVRISDLTNAGKYLTETEEYLSKEGVSESVRVYPGQILLSISASVGKPIISDIDACIHDGLVAFRELDESVHPDYLYYALIDLKPRLLAKGQTGTQSNVNSTLVKRSRIPLPPLSEQRRIANILSTVDQRIQQSSESIEQIEGLKWGLMQDLFSSGTRSSPTKQSTRIGDLPSHWRLSTIGEHSEIVSGTHVKSDLVTDDSSKTPYITGPSDFTDRGFEVTKYTAHPSSFCEEGDTLITVKGMSCGKSTFADGGVSISRQLKAVRPSEELDKRYLFYWVRYKEQLFHTLAEGTRQLGLSTSDISTFPLPVPPLDEQERIGNILSTVDDRLSEEKTCRSKLNELKRGLMQDLLTGQRRLDTDA